MSMLQECEVKNSPGPRGLRPWHSDESGQRDNAASDRGPAACLRSGFAAQISIALIRAYQRWISPYKGFRCPHRLLHRGRSCSEFALHEIRERGVRVALPGIRNQFRECGDAARILRQQRRAARVLVASDGYDLEQPEESGAAHGQTMDERIWEEQEKKQKRLSELQSGESSLLNCTDGAFFSCGTCAFLEPIMCCSPW
ncbi:MAG: membrane protein insertion efficiency factor YidD [Planctomycetaceae bacterium]